MALSAQPVNGWKRWKGWIGFVLGVGLLVAAGMTIASSPGSFDDLLTSLRDAPMWAVVTIIVAPVVSWVLVGSCLRMLLLRHGRVGHIEMLMLVGSAWLLNHLPMRPGLVGRLGYHKVVNNIRIRDAVEATLWSVGFNALSNAMIIALCFVVPDGTSATRLIMVLVAPAAVIGLLGIAAGTRSRPAGLLLGGLSMRYADTLVWLVRYAAVFAAIGIEMTPVQIAMVTAVSQFAQLIPLTGGGVGFREWGVGLAAKQSGQLMQAAIGADLINRIIETIWVIPIGFYSTWWVARSFQRHAGDQEAIEASSPKDQPIRHRHNEHESGDSAEQDPPEG